MIRDRVRAHLLASAEVKRQTADILADEIGLAAELVAGAFERDAKLMLCGNGGSAADSQHIAAEFTNRFRPGLDRRALPALALTTDTSFLTSHGNDFSYETVFSRQVEALGRRGDILIAISTSGNSVNVVRAVLACRELAIQTIGLLGGDGGRLGALVDVPIIVPSPSTQYVQETHIAVGHIIADLVEAAMFGLDGIDFSVQLAPIDAEASGLLVQERVSVPVGHASGAAHARSTGRKVSAR